MAQRFAAARQRGARRVASQQRASRHHAPGRRCLLPVFVSQIRTGNMLYRVNTVCDLATVAVGQRAGAQRACRVVCALRSGRAFEDRRARLDRLCQFPNPAPRCWPRALAGDAAERRGAAVVSPAARAALAYVPSLDAPPACRGGAHQRRHRRVAASRGADHAPRQDEENLTGWHMPTPPIPLGSEIPLRTH